MLSIVTLTYNNIEELQTTLASLPDYNFIESVVINGGDCTGTLEFLKAYKGKSISEKDKGIADAFNKGIKYSSGKAIMFLNSGDILIEPDYLKKVYDILINNSNIHFVHSNILFIDKVGEELFMRPRMKALGRGMPYLHPTMAVKRSVFDKIGLFDLNYKISMDFDLVVRMEKAGCKGFYIDNSPAIKMDGRGKSALNEYEAIRECYTSLKKNNYLTLKNIYGFIVRINLYFFRSFLLKAGGKNVVKLLKRKKYE